MHFVVYDIGYPLNFMGKYMQHNEILNLMTQSILTPAEFNPTTHFLNLKSVGIFVNGCPLMLLGPSDDADSHDLADRLLNNSDFHEMIDTKFGCSAITKGIYENSELQELKYISLTSSVQGEIKKIGNKKTCLGPLLAIFVGDYESSRQISIHCCIQNNIMRCFSPDATNLNPISKNGPAKKSNLYC